MKRLNAKAKDLLQREVEKQAQPLNLEIESSLVRKRLDKLTQESGQPLTQTELAPLVQDLFPQFDSQVLARAAKANRPQPLKGWLILGGCLGAGLVGLAGLTWLVNLPYPMIRRPVARVAPLLLLPSYLEMDRNYREAIAHVEQADQLVNKATSPADIALGAEKVKQAQTNLDKLPVWFLGYEPVRVCSFMGGCSWNFTFDEFQQARAQVGRMDAVIFQETNALTQLDSAETTLQQAKTAYQSATTLPAKQQALGQWQGALAQFALIPPQTLAGKQSQAKQAIYSQELTPLAGAAAGSGQTRTLIAAAQEFAKRANQQLARPSQSLTEWQQTETLWQEAIQRLRQVSPQDPDYVASQSFLADYTQRLGQTQVKRQQEQEAQQAFSEAQGQIKTLLGNPPQDKAALENQLNGIISQLQRIPPGASAYGEAQTLIQQAREQLKKF